MIKSRTRQLGIVLLLTCICISLLGAEPDETTTEVEFELRKDRPPTALMRIQREQPPYDSTHFAILFIRGQWSSHPIKSEKEILTAAAARTMSPIQREHVSTFPFKFIDYDRTIGRHTYYRLYGVGEYDTQKLTKAFIEALANKANKEVEHYLSRQKEIQEETTKIKQELTEKQKEYKAAESKYNKIKGTRFFSLGGLEVYKKSTELMLEMDKLLDNLEIELAGIRNKMKSIEQYRRRKYFVDDGKHFSKETLDKLDQMYVEQMVEFRSVEARKKAALGIRNREKEFLVLFDRRSNLEVEVDKLQISLKNSENKLRDVEEKLANPTPDMQPPKVFQNKVNIYPVK
jgi:cytochrome c556